RGEAGMSEPTLPEGLASCPQTLPAALARAVSLSPQEEAVICNGRRITFAGLALEVDRVAAALVAQGVKRDDHVGICLGNGIPWIVLFHALGRLGAVTVPVNTRLKPEEIAYTLRQSDTSLLFIADHLLKIDFVDVLRGICPAIDSALPDAALPKLTSVVVLGSEAPTGAV